MKFVDQIAQYIENQKLDMDHLVLVLPSIRAKKYVMKALADRQTKPFFAPEIWTIDQWIRENSTYRIQDKLATIFELYKIHQELCEEDEDASFDSFLTWVQMLLSDFEELEKYLVDAKLLFKNLRDIREIERWSPENEPLTEAQEKYLRFWDRLPAYYGKLQAALKKENLAYSGMAFRQVAEEISLVFNKDKDAYFLFCGFNALSKAELTIMRQLRKMGRAEFLINADAYYLKPNHHEAGAFLRDALNFMEIRQPHFVTHKMASEPKRLKVIECTQHIGQVHVASTILAQLSREEIDQTLLLLADEDLVMPMIKNLPLNVEKANITMGIQLRNTPIKLWVDLLFSFQESLERFNSANAYYHKDLARLWKHPFYQALLPKECEKAQLKLEKEITDKNKLFIGKDRVAHNSPLLHEFYRLIGESWGQNWAKALDVMRSLNTMIFQVLTEKEEFEKAIIRAFDANVQNFANQWTNEAPEMARRTFRTLFQQSYNSAAIAYEGNPIEGLQIMGLLETRMLDFQRIICLGLNEGNMPPGNPLQTLIPMDLRAGVGMPTSREKHGLFAHHFYRLLHEVEDMTITYTNMKEEMMSSEASRYLQQIELEWSRENEHFSLEKSVYTLEAETKNVRLDEVEKTAEILAKLDEVLERSLSASGINKFLSCPLDYYYRYLLEYGEEDDVEEEINASSLGTILHEALEEMYTPFAMYNAEGEKQEKARPVTAVDIAEMQAKGEAQVHKGFLKHYDNDAKAFLTGKNYLSYKMAQKLLDRYLVYEKERISKMSTPCWIFGLERSLSWEHTFEVNGAQKTIRLVGNIDRINYLNEKMEVIDYKSGSPSNGVFVIKRNPKKELELEDVLFDTLTHDNGSGKFLLQLFIYGLLIRENLKTIPNKLEIISFIKYPDGGLSLESPDYSMEEMLDAFPAVLERIVREMYDDTIPFQHKDKYRSYCQYCH